MLKFLFLAFIFLQFATILKCVSISSVFEEIPNKSLQVNNEILPISDVFKSRSKLECSLECNKNLDCTNAVFSSSSLECQLYLLIKPLTLGDYENKTSSFVLTKKTTNSCPVCSNMNSTVLRRSEIHKLFELGGYSVNQTLRLLYRATRDGFDEAAFHSKCDNITNTLSIIKSSLGYVFGGFTTQIWNSINDTTFYYRADTQSYILSLRRNISGFNIPDDAQRFNVNSTTWAIGCRFGFMISFGLGYDFGILADSNINNKSYSIFGKSYQLPAGYSKNNINSSAYLAGCTIASGYFCYFSTSEIEVFQLV